MSPEPSFAGYLAGMMDVAAVQDMSEFLVRQGANVDPKIELISAVISAVELDEA